MKLNSSDFIKKYTEGEKKISDNDDVLIELMEDITDSVNNSSEAEIKKLEEEKAKLERDLEDQKEKYKDIMQGSKIDNSEKYCEFIIPEKYAKIEENLGDYLDLP